MSCRKIGFFVGSILIVNICCSFDLVDATANSVSADTFTTNHVDSSSSKLSSLQESQKSHLRTSRRREKDQSKQQLKQQQLQQQSNQINENDISNNQSRNLSFLSMIRSHFNHTHEHELKEEEEDADADDYYQMMLINNMVNSTTPDTSSMWPSSSSWYTLSHYIEPTSILYDTIEGFFLALLFCLMVGTCYTNFYYYCFTRCGLCPDDRIEKSLLNRKARRMKKRNIIPRRRMMERRNGAGARRDKNQPCYYCCGACFCFCCKEDDSANEDSKGDFVPLSTERDDDDSNQDGNSSDHSSLSQDSALSLEYGDEHLADEYGENTDRLIDSKIETAAKAYFEFEEKQAELLQDSQNILQRNVRRSGGSVGNRSRRSRGTRSVRSQTSSILSSESGDSSSYEHSDDDHSIEMESAMMDLELAERRAFNNKQMDEKS